MENYVGIFIDYGLTGPRVPRQNRATAMHKRRRETGGKEVEGERVNARVLTADEGADLRFEIRARNKHEKIITIKTAVSVRDAARCTRFSIGRSDLEHTGSKIVTYRVPEAIGGFMCLCKILLLRQLYRKSYILINSNREE